MKLGTFLLGGLTGAAVVLLMRNRMTMAVADGVGQMFRNRMNQVKEAAVEKGLNKALNIRFGSGWFQDSKAGRHDREDLAEDEIAGGLDEVEKLASKDPQVKHEVNKILSENDQQQLS